MKMSGETIQPLKCALRYKPPVLALIYKDNDTGKTRKRSMPLREFSAETDVEQYAKKLAATPRHEMFIKTIPFPQLHSLLQRVKDAHQNEGRSGPSQTTTPIQQPPRFSLHDAPPLSPLTTPLLKSNKDGDVRESKKFEDDITKLLDLDSEGSGELESNEKRNKILANVVTAADAGFGRSALETTTDEIEDDPLMQVLQGRAQSLIRETLAGNGSLAPNKNGKTDVSPKRLAPLGSTPQESQSTNPFSLSSHFTTQDSSNKLPPLKRRPLGDIPSLTPPKTTPVKSKQENEESSKFEKDIANLLNLGDDDFEPMLPQAKDGLLFDESIDRKGNTTAAVDADIDNDDGDDDEGGDPFWKVLNSKIQSPIHKVVDKPASSTSAKKDEIPKEGPKESGTTGLTSLLGIRELPPLQRAPLSLTNPPQPLTLAAEERESEAAEYSEDFDNESENRELSYGGDDGGGGGGRKDDLLDDFADDKSLSFAIEEIEEESLGIEIDDDDDINELLSGSFSGEDFRNIVTPSSLSTPRATDHDAPQSTKIITGAQLSDEDLNKASDDYVSKRKEEMEVMFLANQVKPGDEAYVYDKEVDFEQGPKIESCGWDTDSEMSDF